MRAFLRLGLCAALVSLAGCAGVQKRQDVALSKGLYSAKASIEKGRYDLAESYINQAARLVPPPKKPIAIQEFKSQGKTYAVLPQSQQNTPTLAKGSQPFNDALGQDKRLQAQINDEGKVLGTFSKQADDIVRAKDNAAQNEEKEPFYKKLLHIAGWLTLPLLAVGTVALAVFVPESIPFLLAIGKLIKTVAGALLEAGTVVLQEVEAEFSRKAAPSG